MAVEPLFVDGLVVLLLSGTVPAVLPGVPVAPAVPVVPPAVLEPMLPVELELLPIEPDELPMLPLDIELGPEEVLSGIDEVVAGIDEVDDELLVEGELIGALDDEGVVVVSSAFLPQALNEKTAAIATVAKAAEENLDVCMCCPF